MILFKPRFVDLQRSLFNAQIFEFYHNQRAPPISPNYPRKKWNYGIADTPRNSFVEAIGPISTFPERDEVY
jgi:hypothetical protein